MEAIKGKISADNWQSRGKSEQKVKDQQKCPFLIDWFSKNFNFEQYFFKLLSCTLDTSFFKIVFAKCLPNISRYILFNIKIISKKWTFFLIHALYFQY